MSDLLIGRGYGRVVGFAGAPGSLAAVRDAVPFWWEDADAGVRPEHVVEVASPEAAALRVRLLERWVAEHAVDRVFVHAACVAVDGVAIVVPGRSWTGKSTLCAALLRRGATYLSDEYAVFDSAGRVHPYPRPVQVRHGFDRVPTTAADLGAEVATSAHRVGLVAALRHDADAGWAVDGIAPGAAVLQLLDNALCAQSRSEAALDAATAVMRGARCLVGTRGEADETVDALLGLL